jgi:uncharacterized membrane protein
MTWLVLIYLFVYLVANVLLTFLILLDTDDETSMDVKQHWWTYLLLLPLIMPIAFCGCIYHAVKKIYSRFRDIGEPDSDKPTTEV